MPERAAFQPNYPFCLRFEATMMDVGKGEAYWEKVEYIARETGATGAFQSSESTAVSKSSVGKEGKKEGKRDSLKIPT